jgi:hypothetical protein
VWTYRSLPHAAHDSGPGASFQNTRTRECRQARDEACMRRGRSHRSGAENSRSCATQAGKQNSELAVCPHGVKRPVVSQKNAGMAPQQHRRPIFQAWTRRAETLTPAGSRSDSGNMPARSGSLCTHSEGALQTRIEQIDPPDHPAAQCFDHSCAHLRLKKAPT